MKPDDGAITSALAAALPAARWFAGKSAALDRVTVREAVSPPGAPSVHLVLADVTLADVTLADGIQPQRYFVPLDDAGHDAAAAPPCIRWLLETVFAGHSAAGDAGSFVGHAAGSAATVGRACDVVAIAADASNSSLVVRSDGRAWLVKLFRRCRQGIHPEVELGEFFTAAAQWSGTPRFRGWLAYEEAGRPATALATVHDFVSGATSAWARLSSLVAAGVDERSAAHLHRIVVALGRTTADMHRALASRPDLPAFAPEPMTAADARLAATRMAEHAGHVFDLAAARLEALPPAVAERVRGLLDARAGLLRRFAPVTDLAISIPQIRVHGDYHLGQVLLGDADDHVFVIDFEGEPGRSLDERRAKTAAAKDVAGMCRSFDYLLRHAAKTAGTPYDVALLRRLEGSFLDAYRAGTAGGGWWPSDAAVADRLLAIFKLDKAIYELAYELANRPDWVDVPLAALDATLATDC